MKTLLVPAAARLSLLASEAALLASATAGFAFALFSLACVAGRGIAQPANGRQRQACSGGEARRRRRRGRRQLLEAKKKKRPPSSRCYTPCILWQHCFGRCLCQGASWGAHLELLGGRLLARTHGGFFLGRHDSVREMLTEVVSKIFSLDAHSARVLAPCNCPRVETGGSHALATSQRWFVRRELSISLSEVLAAPPPLRQRAPPPLSAFASSSGPCWARVIICRAGVGRGSFCACACITGRLHRAVPGQLMPPPADPLLRCSSAACYRLLVFNATGRIICCISEAAAGEREQQSRGESGRSGAAEQSDKQTRAGAGAGTRPDQTRAGGGASLRSGPCACDPCTWSLA